jgi:hypothetical protein
LLACAPVHAQWVLINKDSEVANYYESTIRKIGTMVKVYELFDYKVPSQPDNAKSVGYLVKYDCHADTLQVLTTIKYSENMAAGMVLSNDATPGPLNPIAPGTVGAKKMDHICRLARQLG